MKNSYEDGGLRAPDVECLDRALKLKQLIRADNSNHLIKRIQEIEMINLGNDEVIKQEYDRLSDEDWLIRVGQETINTLTEWARREGYGTSENGQSSTIAINTVGSINILTYLKRKKEPLIECLFRKFQLEGIESLNELLIEEEYTTEKEKLDTIKVIRNRFPEKLIKIGENYDGEINAKLGILTHFYTGENTFVPVKEITVKTLQHILKIATNKTKTVDYNRKLDINNFDKDCIIETRLKVSNVKLRNVFYRLINKDFFTKVRMCRFKMVDNNTCERCGLEETVKHLLWECVETRLMWESFNTILGRDNLAQFFVNEYKDVYKFNSTGAVSTIKLKLINELIQIKRPTNMNVLRVEKIVNQIHCTEKYISKKYKKEKKFENKWKLITISPINQP